MIHLTHEGPEPTSEQKRELAERYNRIFGNHIIVRREFTGKILTPEEFQEFQKIVNERRPYCGSDFVPHPAGFTDVADFIKSHCR